jgi:ribose transport system permease protein
VAAVVALLAWAALRYTRFGMRTLAAGSSRVAAERSGLRLRPHLLALFALGGALCGLAGFIDIARFTSTTLAGHQLDALAAITAVVIGGGALAGGRVSIPGAVLGAFLIVVLQVGLVVVGLNPFWQLIAIGAVLVVAVSLERHRPGSSAHA